MPYNYQLIQIKQKSLEAFNHLQFLSTIIEKDIDKKTIYKKEIDNLLPLEKILYIKNKNYFKEYVLLAIEACRYLGSPIHQSVNEFSSSPSVFTDHGSTHAYSVVKITNILTETVSPSKDLSIISQTEAFILLVSAWIHDIGMFVHLPGFTKEDIRKYHGKVSGNLFGFIVDNKNKNFPIAKKYLTEIVLVAAAHQTKIEFSNLINYKSDKIRLVLLGALLRLADALDIDEYRADRAFFSFLEDFFGDPNDTSFFEWSVNFCTKYLNKRTQILSKTNNYKLTFDKAFIETIKKYKETEYKRIFENSTSSVDSIIKDLQECEEKVKDIYEYSFSTYIKYYILDHINSFTKNTNDPLLTNLKDFLLENLSIKISSSEQVPLKDLDPKNRETYVNIYDNKSVFWVSSINQDNNITERFKALKSAIAKNKKVISSENPNNFELLLFVYDNEFNKLRLISSPNLFNNNYITENQEYKKNPIKFQKDLGKDVCIPIKCGIIGFIAWSGLAEIVEKEWQDPRASYSKYDNLLRLHNLMIFNVFEEITKADGKKENKFLGVFLLNFDQSKKEEWDYFTSNFINVADNNNVINSFSISNFLMNKLGGEIEFKELVKALQPHKVK